MTSTAAGISPTAPDSPVVFDLTKISVQILDSSDQLPADEWASITKGFGFYSSPRWLRFLEDDPAWDTWYLTARDAGESLIAVVPGYLPSGGGEPHGDSHFYDPATSFAGPPGLLAPADGRSWLLLGGRCGYETELLVRPELGLAERNSVLSAVHDRAAKLAAAWGVSGIAMMHLVPADAGIAGSALGRRPVLSEVTSEFNLAGTSSFDGLVERLSGHRRRRIRQEIRRFAAAELRLRWTCLSDAIDQLAPLAARHQQRYGHSETSELLAVHLAQQAEQLDDLSRVLLCERQGVAIGALLAYEWQGAWYPRLGAAGDGLRDQQAALFNLFYYAPVTRAINSGASRYVTGPSSLPTKLLRGASVAPRWSVLTGQCDEVQATLSSQRWNAARIATWQAELGINLTEPR